MLSHFITIKSSISAFFNFNILTVKDFRPISALDQILISWKAWNHKHFGWRLIRIWLIAGINKQVENRCLNVKNSKWCWSLIWWFSNVIEFVATRPYFSTCWPRCARFFLCHVNSALKSQLPEISGIEFNSLSGGLSPGQY